MGKLTPDIVDLNLGDLLDISLDNLVSLDDLGMIDSN